MAPKKNYKVAIQKAEAKVNVSHSRLSKLIDPNGKRLSGKDQDKAQDYFNDLLSRLDDLHTLRTEAKGV